MSYAIGDESDDEFEAFNSGGGAGRRQQQQQASGSSHPLSLHSQGTTQAHQYVDDPFADAASAAPGAGSTVAAAGNRAPLMEAVDDGDALLDFTGGQSANPQGTAGDTRRGPGLYGGLGGNNSRYDVYEE